MLAFWNTRSVKVLAFCRVPSRLSTEKLTSIMHPEFIQIGSRTIYWYGVLMAAAFLAGMMHWRLLGRREGRDAAFCTDLAFWIMVAGILGARVSYVVANCGHYAQHPWDIPRIDKGGVIYYGGFIGAVIAVAVIARLRREPLLALGDFAITAVPLGHALGRIGCFLNGCCYGVPGTAPWCVVLPAVDGTPRQPVQLYEAAFNLALYVFLTLTYRKRRPSGTVLALYLLTYPMGRFLLEFLRGDERLHGLGLTHAQIISVMAFVVGLCLWTRVGRSHALAHGR